MDGKAAHVVAGQLALAGMKPRPNFNRELADGGGDRASAPDSAGRTVESGEKPIPGNIDFAPPKACELAPDDGMVTTQQVGPPAVSERRSALGRPDYVCKEHGREHTIRFGPCRTPVRNSSISSSIE